MRKIVYPTAELVVAINDLALTFVRAKKSDKHEVLSTTKIIKILEECELSVEDVYYKAVILLKGIIQQHPFASGNRRTAFMLMLLFLQNNNCKCAISDMPENAKVLQGIRERYYTDDELKEWIKNGKIRTFIR
jgi:death-on-curing family protein